MKTSLQAVAAIAATSFYFLLFAQFAFLEGLAERGGEGFLKPVLAAMGAGGMGGSFLAPVLVRRFGARALLRAVLFLCGLFASVSIFLEGMPGAVALAIGMGAALGVATVTLAGSLPEWTVPGRGALAVGAGTGLAYGLCNVPVIFESDWAAQSWMSAAVAVAGALAVPREREWPAEVAATGGRAVVRIEVVLAVLFFLVWLDAAAFYIIQHTDELKKETWGSADLWRNAGLHVGAALLAGWLLDRGWLWRILYGALAILSAAALMVNHARFAQSAGVLYPVAVSLYSVALVAVPGLLSGAGSRAVALLRAAWVFAIAGWVGSALGVGMGENLERVPAGFVFAAWGLALGGRWWFGRPGRRVEARVLAGILGVMGAGWVFTCFAKEERGVLDAVARGREVYLSEGCIHCHSRYVRPGTRDELWWGPPVGAAQILEERPVLIGNRRQGPDLLQVGLRRSAVWLELKLREPRGLDAGSAMPGYGHLFEDGRGKDLVAFLGAVREGDFEKRLGAMGRWVPGNGAGAIVENGAAHYRRRCATCHGEDGRGAGALAGRFLRPPTNLVEGPFLHTIGEDGPELRLRMARVVKFGIPGTDMAGHELIEDGEVWGLVEWVLGLRTDGGVE